MSTELNSSLRHRSPQECTIQVSPNKQVADFFNRFGFEKILRYIILGQLNSQKHEGKKALPQPVTKGLKKNMKSDKVVNIIETITADENTNDFSSYSENIRDISYSPAYPHLSIGTHGVLCDARESVSVTSHSRTLLLRKPDGFRF